MACKRNRITELVQYLESLGIEVNIGKNKARGNKGLFKVCSEKFRIDIAKGQSDETILKTLIHEFAHFIHYNYDKTLQSLDFIIVDSEDLTEELIRLTVDSIPKDSISPIFNQKESIKNEIKSISKNISNIYPDFKISEPFKPIEQRIKKTNLRYLLKYDKVKLIEGFSIKFYSINDLDAPLEIKNYLKLKSLQRALKRVNSKITRLNKYYNSPTELFARALEIYITNRESFIEKAPVLVQYFDNTELSQIKNLKKIVLQDC